MIGLRCSGDRVVTIACVQDNGTTLPDFIISFSYMFGTYNSLLVYVILFISFYIELDKSSVEYIPL